MAKKKPGVYAGRVIAAIAGVAVLIVAALGQAIVGLISAAEKRAVDEISGPRKTDNFSSANTKRVAQEAKKEAKPLKAGARISNVDLGFDSYESPFFDDRWPYSERLPVQFDQKDTVVREVSGTIKPFGESDKLTRSFELKDGGQGQWDGIDLTNTRTGTYQISVDILHVPYGSNSSRHAVYREFTEHVAEVHSAASILASGGRKGLFQPTTNINEPPEFLSIEPHVGYLTQCLCPLRKNWQIAYLVQPKEGASFTLIGPYGFRATIDPNRDEITCRLEGRLLQNNPSFEKPSFTWQSLQGADRASFFMAFEPGTGATDPTLILGCSRPGHHKVLGRFNMPPEWKAPDALQPVMVGIVSDVQMRFGGLEVTTVYETMDRQ